MKVTDEKPKPKPFQFTAAISFTRANETSIDNTTSTSRPSVVESETQETFETPTAAKEKASYITTFLETRSSSSGQKKPRTLDTTCTGRSCVSVRAGGGEWIFS